MTLFLKKMIHNLPIYVIILLQMGKIQFEMGEIPVETMNNVLKSWILFTLIKLLRQIWTKITLIKNKKENQTKYQFAHRMLWALRIWNFWKHSHWLAKWNEYCPDFKTYFIRQWLSGKFSVWSSCYAQAFQTVAQR